jgi:mono/diheme cytochrome c family protein
MTRAPLRAARRAAALLALAGGAGACGPPTSGKPVAELWREHCAQCHGAEGTGHPGWKGTDPKVDLTVSELARRDARGQVFQRIAYGYGTMPGFAHKLERGDLEMLTQYVFELSRPAAAGR